MTGAVIPPIYATSAPTSRTGSAACAAATSTAARPTRRGPRSRAHRGRSRRASAASRSPPASPPRTPCCGRCCRPGDHVVVPDDAYGGTYRLFDKVAQALGRSTTARRRSPTSTRCAPRSGPARPSWSGSRRRPTRCSNIGDIEALAAVAHEAGRAARRRQHLRLAVPPAAARRSAPTSCVHSTTKYAGGHCDVVGGAVVVGARPRRLGREGRLPPELDGRRRRPVRRLARPCAGSRRWACGWTGTATTPRRSSSSSTATRRVTAGASTPASPSTPATTVAAAPDEALRRHGLLPGHRRRGRRRSTVCERDRGLHARGVARRRRVADRAPGPDDPRLASRAPTSRCPPT